MSLYDFMKDVISIARKADNIELERALLDASAKALELDNENNSLRQEITVLKKQLEFKGNLVYIKERNSYWDKETNEGPFCSGCWDHKKEVIRLVEYSKTAGRYKCPICDHIYDVDEDQTRPFQILCKPPERC